MSTHTRLLVGRIMTKYGAEKKEELQKALTSAQTGVDKNRFIALALVVPTCPVGQQPTTCHFNFMYRLEQGETRDKGSEAVYEILKRNGVDTTGLHRFPTSDTCIATVVV